VGIWEGTLTGSWWHEPEYWWLVSDKLVFIPGIANSNDVAMQAHYLDDVVNTPGVRTRPSLVQAKDDNAVTHENSEAGFGSLRIVKGVDRLIYDQPYRHGGMTSRPTSTTRCISRYLLTFSTWRLSVNCIPGYNILVLGWSQQGYFSFEVQSCMFIIQFYIANTSIAFSTWLFLVP